ncbi:MAG: acyl-CoA dehydrogenase family protein [Myxococcota bacterium]
MASSATVDPSPIAYRGGGFVFLPVLSAPIFTREAISDEQKSFAKTAHDFAVQDVEPHAAAIERKQPGLMLQIMKKAAEIGMFMVEIPEEYGGLGLDKVTAMVMGEEIARNASFSVTIGAHTNIGTMPTVYYGTEDQKARYLPKLASGELLAAYCLSEPDSGSDALSAKTTAVLNEEGTHYVMNGTKQWITNGAFADLFTVFAQVDGDKFTAFLVEKSFSGVSLGAEEHKLGIRGSSTTQLILEDVHVPVENVLGEVGRGHKIAFNILNIGRWKLGAATIGGAKHVLAHAAKYASERKQFGKPLSDFGLIQEKLARSAMLIFAGESMAYRTGGLIDERIAELDASSPSFHVECMAVIEEFSIEASILKVFGSEAGWMIADEALQIHGGNGYVEDYPVERSLRDMRINRIFEGTNEINRMLIPGTILKRAMKGELPLLQFSQDVMGELNAPETLPKPGAGPLGNELCAVELSKRAATLAASKAVQKHMQGLQEQQVLLAELADLFIAVYAMDSALARAHQGQGAKPDARSESHLELARLFVAESRGEVMAKLRRIGPMLCDGAELDEFFVYVSLLDRPYAVDVLALQRSIAARVVEGQGA